MGIVNDISEDVQKVR